MKFKKHILTAVMFLTALPFTSANAMDAAAKVGAMAPDFTATDALTGESFKLSDHKGEIVVLEWSNHDCPFVRKHYDSGNMQDTQKEALANENVKWVTIVSSAEGKQGYVSADEAKKIVMDEGASISAKILDPSGEIGHLYGAQTTPHMYVINAEGVLAYAGAIDDKPSPSAASLEGATNYVKQALGEIEAGEAVSVAQTKPYGCGIKY